MYFAASIINDLYSYAAKRGLSMALPEAEEQDYVSYEAVVRILMQLGRTLNDPCLGLHMGEQIQYEATAIVDDIMRSSTSLEQSIRHAIDYAAVISDALQCSLRIDHNHYAVIYEEHPSWRVQPTYARRQILDMALLANVTSLATYTRQHYFPLRIHLSYPRPRVLHEYYRLFNCTLSFSQPTTEIVYSRTILRRHDRSEGLGLLQDLKNRAADIMQRMPRENELIYQVKRCILIAKPGRMTVPEVAHELLLSRRTLQRRLSELGTSFKQVESELLLHLAKTYLTESDKSLDEISYLMGLSESSALIRFFKDNCGQTPARYRQQLQTMI